MNVPFTTLCEALAARAAATPDRRAYTFLGDSEEEQASITYGELAAASDAVAAALVKRLAPGDRTLLLYPPGLELIVAFLGCVKAGVLAVPAQLPGRRGLDRLLAIARDCRPGVLLTNRATLPRLLASLGEAAGALPPLDCIATDDLPAGSPHGRAATPDIGPETVAFLQYTSGSTSDPKGVMVTHHNLIYNCAYIDAEFLHDEDSLVVSWLPFFHDMGLIYGVLEPLLQGIPAVLLSPVSFLQQPKRWLDAISRYGATHSGGPNFAYDLCVRRIEAEQLAGLDLSRWRVAFNGAEPIHTATLDRFATHFAPSGFSFQAFAPSYGLAEATLKVSAVASRAVPTLTRFDSAALARDCAEAARAEGEASTRLVGCGRPGFGTEVAIVDAATRSALGPHRVGEIWVRGPGVAAGYWERHAETEQVFRATIAGDCGPGGPYLRTGDLGFLVDGELFVNGRAKDLIIVHGLNHYPQDVERSVTAGRPGLRAGCGAAFAVELEGEERLVVVQEIDERARLPWAALLDDIHQSIVEEHEIQPAALLLVKAGEVPKTTSGKVQRRACRDRFLAGALKVVEEWRSDRAPRTASPPAASPTASPIQESLVAALAAALGCDPARVDPQKPLRQHGLDSIAAIALQHRVERDLGLNVPMVTFLGRTSLAEVAASVVPAPTPAPKVPAAGEAAAPAADPPADLTSRLHPLSHGQRALWFIQHLDPESAAYNLTVPFRVSGSFSTAALAEVVDRLVERHPALRTTFPEHDGEPLQQVHAQLASDLRIHDAAEWSAEDVQRFVVGEAYRPFDLGGGPLLRVRVLRLGVDDHLLMLVVHHIVADFWSLAVVFRELRELYAAAVAGRVADLAPLPLSYVEHVAVQNRRLAGDLGARLDAYWTHRLAGDLPPLELPLDHPRPPRVGHQGKAVRCQFSPDLLAALQALCRERGTTLFTGVLGLFQALLGRVAGQSRVLVGVPTAGREHASLSGLVGYFANPVVLDADLADEPSFNALLDRQGEMALNAFAHQELPFPLVVERLHPRRDPERSPIFQVLLSWQASPTPGEPDLAALALGEAGVAFDLGPASLTSWAFADRPAAFDLSLLVAPAATATAGMIASLLFRRDLFASATAAHLADRLLVLAAAATAEPDQPLAELDLFTTAERLELTAERLATRRDELRHRSMPALFVEQVRRHPDRVAVTIGGAAVSYGELHRRARRLAGHLRTLGVRAESLVGVCLERSLDVPTALLAVVDAGGAYVPLDPRYPAERLAATLADGDVRWVVTTSELAPLFAPPVRTVCLDRDATAIAAGAPHDLPSPLPGQLAYTIYTSGSTGRPKGVQVPHAALANLLLSMRRDLPTAPGDALLAVTTIAFDIAGLEIFLPLVSGARLALATAEDAADGRRLAALARSQDINVMQATPATWRLLLAAGFQAPPHLTLLCGGEALPRELADRLLAHGAALWNVYGPTETTIWSTAWRVTAAAPIAIGRPLANTTTVLLDPSLRPVPRGSLGELAIGGVGVARGYLGRPELTAERFVPDPLATEPGSRVYRTGDVARQRLDGELDCAGRLDHQVKIRGFRIELGEIESVLAAHPAVAEAAAMALQDEHRGARLAAWYVLRAGADAEAADLRAWLRTKLPEHMVPAHFLRLAALPSTPNGKLDRRALTLPASTAPGANGAAGAARNRAERQIVEIWQEALGVTGFGVEESFFDLGGHSLLLPQVRTQLCRRFDRDISTLDLFRHPTVAALARLLAGEEAAARPARSGRSRAEGRRQAAGEPPADIAVVAAAGRFPGAPDLDAYWNLLREGREGVSFFAPADVEAWPGGEQPPAGGGHVRAWGVLDGVELLDAPFFGLSPAEAASIDPQARIFLECAWEALERAGCDPQRFPGAIGVFAGAAQNTYLHLLARQDGNTLGALRAMVGNEKDFLATRVSYKLDLRGPSVTVQTACSTSLVAIHLACQSLRAAECDAALAGGVTIRLPQRAGYFYAAGGILSPDGHCRAFDQGGQGTVGGNGAGVVVLKRLVDALRDGDHVHAVLKGSAINNDGAQKVGFTAPGVAGQAEVIIEALAVAGVDAASIGYVEAHGTATELGDPIEIAALSQAFGGGGGATDGSAAWCAIGSAKTNVGHLDAAAGVAGFLKTVLAVERGLVPPSLHFTVPNPRLDLGSSPFFVNTRLRPWPDRGGPRRAGVSSFGIGGTNAHVIVEQAPDAAIVAAPPPARPWQILPLAARTRSALEAMRARLAAHLRNRGAGVAAPGGIADTADLADIAFTLQVGRRAFGERHAIVCRDRDEAAAALAAALPAATPGAVRADRPVAFLLPGLGDHYAAMARGLYTGEPGFRRRIDEAAEILDPLLEGGFLRRLYPAEDGVAAAPGGRDFRRLLLVAEEPSAGAPPADTAFVHAAIFAVEHALAGLLTDWGIAPRALLGYSVGEYVAACLAGVLRFPDALRVVAERGRHIDRLPAGAMLAVPLPEAAVTPWLGPGVQVAACNGPAATVLSGAQEEIAALQQRLLDGGLVSRRLSAGHAFHTTAMAPAGSALRSLLGALQLAPPRIPYLSNLTGTWITPQQAMDPDYWVRQMCSPVRFASGAGVLLAEADTALLEVGPGQGLSSFIKQHPGCDSERGRLVLPTLGAAYEHTDDGRSLLAAVARLWASGVEVDWAALHGGERRRRVVLPTYPFERQRHWVDTGMDAGLARAPETSDATAWHKQPDLADWFYVPRWQRAAAPAPPELPAVEPTPGAAIRPWLVFTDGDGVGEQVAQRLAATGREVVRVRAGEGFHQDAPGRCTLDPASSAGFRQLLASLSAPPAGIVHLWSAEPATDALPALSTELDRGFYSLLHLAQALGALLPPPPLRLTVATRRLWRIVGDETLLPVRATLLGACRALPLELAGATCRVVDLDTANAATAALQLLAEIDAPATAEDCVAYRAGERWAETFAPRRLPAATAEAAGLRQGGVYLLTGGFGGLGKAFAEDLARGVGARLALVGRTPLPPRQEWPQRLAGDDAVRDRIAFVLALEEMGATVLPLAADVADPAAVRHAVREARQHFGALHGVIHAAGVPGMGLAQHKSRAAASAVLAPKVQGTLALEAALADEPCDFLVLCGSIAAVAGGGPGQFDYAAANAFLDAHAEDRDGRSQHRVLAIDWSEWQWNSWQAGLAGFRPEVRERLVAHRRALGITATEGADALRRALASPLPRLVVAPRDLAAAIAEVRSFTVAGTLAAAPVATQGAVPPAPAAPKNGLEHRIAAIWQRILGVAELGWDDNFFDLGGNSLLGLQLVTDLERELGIEAAAVSLYESPTVRAFIRRFAPSAPSAPAPAPAVAATAGGAADSAAIAIVAMAGRFPGARDVDELWQNLLAGRESIVEPTDDDLRAAGLDPAALPAGYVRAAAVLDEIEGFDAGLFGYSPREAELMDPQHRLFLECAWEALERAGYDAGRHPGAIGVFAGSNISTYLLSLVANRELFASLNRMQANLLNAADSLTTKVSYKLDLRGPSVAVQTFCSTSAVAVHMACQSLLRGECDMALAGGVSVRVPHRTGYVYEAGGIDSPDGHTRAFDAAANGALLGNGVALLLLKPLEKALADADPIHAVIRGSAINNDGAGKAGYTAPSVEAQASVIAGALAAAGVPAASIGYVEAHGTGTRLGDPIEVAALSQAFRRDTAASGFCALGSLKTNVGHLDRAAGAASLIKAALAVEHGMIPASLHYERPNPEIDFAASPFFVNAQLRPWPGGAAPRRAGVNSLGIGGTNVHFVLEQPPARPPAATATVPGPQVLTLSAATETALDDVTRRLAETLRQSGSSLADVAYTLQVGRRPLAHRRILVARDAAEAADALSALDPRRVFTHRHAGGAVPRPVYLLPGLGDQYPGLGAALYVDQPVFRAALDECAELLRPELGTDLRRLLFPQGAGRAAAAAQEGTPLQRMLHRGIAGTAAGEERALDPTEVAQPAMFAVQVALARLLGSWGLAPRAMIGYSLGEYVAAWLAGVFPLADALTLVARRARWIGALPRGAMLAVPLGTAAIESHLERSGELELAADNGPGVVVVSGPEAAIEELAADLGRRQIPCRRLQTTHAFHSRAMEPVRGALVDLVRTLAPQPPALPYLSNVTGDWITAAEATDPEYWGRHLCRTVRFGDGLERLLTLPDPLFFEVGAGQNLGSFLKQHPAATGAPTVLSTLPAAYDRQSASTLLLNTLGRAWSRGATIDWPAVHAGEERRRVALPTYPFERRRYWIDTTPELLPTIPMAEKKPDIGDWFYLPVWRRHAIQAGPVSHDEHNVCLVFDEGTGLGAAVAARFAAAGRRVVRITPDGTAHGEGASFAFDPRQPAGYAQLISELSQSRLLPRHVVHLWSAAADAEPSVAAAQESGFYSVLFLARSLATLPPSPTAIGLAIGASGLFALDESEVVTPGRTTLIGLAKVLPQEIAHLRCAVVDLPASAAAGESEQIVAEVLGGLPDPVVALRRGERWVQELDPVRLEAAAAPPRLRQGGVYLITGGLGGVGLLLAEHLAARYGARLVLTGRHGLAPDDARAERIRAIERAGGAVLVLAADAADAIAMRRVVDQAEASFGVLHGVIHAAGKVDLDASHIVQRIERAACEAFFAAKLDGVTALAEALHGRPLDFCFLFSSISTVLGGLGFAAYAAANSFADGFARARRGGDTLWLSVDWDTWKVHPEASRGRESQGLERTVAGFAMEPAEALAAFERVLDAAPGPQIVQSSGDLAARLDQWVRRRATPRATAERGAPPPRYARPQLVNRYAPAQSAGERRIAAIWQQVLGVEQVGVQDNYFDLGGTSLSALEVVAALQREFVVELSPILLFEAPTVADLARHLGGFGGAALDGTDRLARAVERRRRARGGAAPDSHEIAIIGMAGRFPGAADIGQLWHNVRNGVESLSVFTDEELAAAGVSAADRRDPRYVRARPILDDVAGFDAAFFGYSPREANFLSPQHRLFLETAWQGLEHAGYDSQAFDGSIGVFGGSNFSTYYLTLLNSPEVLASFSELETAIANDRDSLATSVSYKLDLKGPSFTVQTFCSTSLVAVHLACQSLRSGECEMALAGGVSVRVPQKVGYLFQEGGQDSPDGHTRTFDAQARGTVFGDGVGIVVLKRLADALADGDCIHAVIKGSATNNDGAGKVGYTAPSVEGQAEVVAAALADAGVDAGSLQYVEAHGTATELGDPIEVAALTRAFQASGPLHGRCVLGSVKTNVGHLDRAAGVTGLIKTVLSLRHRVIPPLLHFEHPNPRIDFAGGQCFEIAAQAREWPVNGTPRRAGVNSLGVGGTNVHLVLEEAPTRPRTGPARAWQILPLSARTETALAAAAAALAVRLDEHIAESAVELADVAYTLQVGRRPFEHRRFVVCRTAGEARAAFAAPALAGATLRRGATDVQAAFLFPDAAELPPGLGVTLEHDEPALRVHLKRCADLLGQPLDLSAGGPLAATALTYALAQLLAEWGVRPSLVAGRGTGAYAAAAIAGVLSLADALDFARQSNKAERTPLYPPAVPCLVAHDGAWLTAAEAGDPASWGALHGSPTTQDEELPALLTGTADLLLRLGPPTAAEARVGGEGDTESTSEAIVTVVAALPALATGAVGAPEPELAALLVALGRLWQAGVRIDWLGFHAGECRQRVELPTYPFERQHCWIEGRAASAPTANLAPTLYSELMASPALARKPDLANWFYATVWKQSLAVSAGTWKGVPVGRCWLLFDGDSLSRKLARHLAERGERVISVHDGLAFSPLGDTAFCLRPDVRADYDQLLAELARRGESPARVVHLGSLGTAADGDLDATLRRGFDSLLLLVQALGERGAADNLEIDIVASGLHAVLAGEEIEPAKATLMGICRVVPVEYPGTRCRTLDFTREEPGSRGEEEQVQHLLAELGTSGGEPIVAWRHGQRWVQDFEAVPLAEPPPTQRVFRQRGVYLITGGMGGIGLLMADYLARTVAARLVLLGRSALPPREAWPALLAGDGDRRQAARIRQVQALEAAGAEVLTVAADVSDKAQVTAAVTLARGRFGALHGVLHLAGVPGEGLMQRKSVEMARRVMAPKVQGTVALAAALASEELDFMALFGSITAVTGGGPGQVDYCAANAFLDAFARDDRRQRRHGRTVSIAWGEWQWNAWGGGLDGFDPAVREVFERYRQQFGIHAHEGEEALRRILASPLAGCIVSTQDLTAVLAASRGLNVATILKQVQPARPAQAVHPRPSLGTSYVAPRGANEVRMSEAWTDLLRLEQVGIHDNFFELGGNSLMGLQLVTRLRDAFGVEIPPYALYDAPTVATLCTVAWPADDDGAPSASDERRQRGELRRLQQQARHRQERPDF